VTLNPTPSAADWTPIAKLPDWSGVWSLAPLVGGGPGFSEPPAWTPKAAARVARMRAVEAAGRPENVYVNCLPEGMPSFNLMSLAVAHHSFAMYDQASAPGVTTIRRRRRCCSARLSASSRPSDQSRRTAPDAQDRPARHARQGTRLRDVRRAVCVDQAARLQVVDDLAPVRQSEAVHHQAAVLEPQRRRTVIPAAAWAGMSARRPPA
jgi:hypothetical protein